MFSQGLITYENFDIYPKASLLSHLYYLFIPFRNTFQTVQKLYKVETLVTT